MGVRGDRTSADSRGTVRTIASAAMPPSCSKSTRAWHGTSQLAGDRVQTEYYLQFADHYFRVLSESRARFEDQRRQRGDDLDDDEGDEEFEGAEAEVSNEERQDRPDRNERQDRAPRSNRRDREPRRFNRDERSASDADEQSDEASRMNGRDDSLPLDVLPPSIGAERWRGRRRACASSASPVAQSAPGRR